MDIKELEQLLTKYKDGTISQEEFIDIVNASGDKGLIGSVKIIFDRLEWEASEIEKYRVENKMDEEIERDLFANISILFLSTNFFRYFFSNTPIIGANKYGVFQNKNGWLPTDLSPANISTPPCEP